MRGWVGKEGMGTAAVLIASFPNIVVQALRLLWIQYRGQRLYKATKFKSFYPRKKLISARGSILAATQFNSNHRYDH